MEQERHIPRPPKVPCFLVGLPKNPPKSIPSLGVLVDLRRLRADEDEPWDANPQIQHQLNRAEGELQRHVDDEE